MRCDPGKRIEGISDIQNPKHAENAKETSGGSFYKAHKALPPAPRSSPQLASVRRTAPAFSSRTSSPISISLFIDFLSILDPEWKLKSIRNHEKVGSDSASISDIVF